MKGKKKAEPAPYEMKPHQREVFDAIAPELSTREFRPLNQRYWSQKLGVLQQRVSQILGVLVTEEVLLVGEPNGNLKTYKLNAKHPVLQN